MGNTRKLAPIQLSPNVIGAINEELFYQSTLEGNNRADSREHGVEGQLACLKVYTDEAFISWVKTKGDEKALNDIRKIAAIAIRALETYGCPKRDLIGG